MMRVSVIIPAWNLWDMTAACLRSLAEHSVGEHIEVLVVDNGSEDATATELEPLGHSLFGTAFKALHLPHNMGFARACNAGATAAAGELLFFLNNDTVCTAGWLPPLREAIADTRVGAVGPLLLYPDNSVQHCGVCFSPFCQVGHLYGHFSVNFRAVHKSRPLQAITGAALMLRKEVFKCCGGFFEEYHNGFEDIDLCCSIRAKGMKLQVASQSRIYHHTSQTPGRFDREHANSALLWQRYGHMLRPDEHTLAALDGYVLQMGPTLATWMTLPAEAQQQRNTAVNAYGFSEETCRNMLAREPLWHDGWFLLVQYLEKQGKVQEALEVLQGCWWLFPEEKTLVLMLHLHTKLGLRNPALESLLKKYQHPDLVSNEARVQTALQGAVAVNDRMLTTLLNTWLQRYGTQQY